MQGWTDILTTAPLQEPVCVDEVKNFLRIDHNDDDTMLAAFITTARKWVEDYCYRALFTQTRTLKRDYFPSCDVINVARAPLASVTSIVYTDSNGDSQTLSTANYQVDTSSTPPRIGLKDGYSWPTTKTNTFNTVTITYVAGWTTVDAIPTAIKEAIKRIVRGLFEGCSMDEAADGGTVALLSDYRVFWPC